MFSSGYDSHVNVFLQVWIIADKVPGHSAESSGTVCHRLGVRPMQPKGLSWDFGIGVSFQVVYNPPLSMLTNLDLIRHCSGSGL